MNMFKSFPVVVAAVAMAATAAARQAPASFSKPGLITSIGQSSDVAIVKVMLNKKAEAEEITKASGEYRERKVYCRKGKHYISIDDCLPSKIDGYVICQEHNEEIRVE
jgi:uncharacterized cupredoxin-like copper-binding protein